MTAFGEDDLGRRQATVANRCDAHLAGGATDKQEQRNRQRRRVLFETRPGQTDTNRCGRCGLTRLSITVHFFQ